MIDKMLLEEAANSVIEKDMEKAERIANEVLKLGLNPTEFISNGFTIGIVKVGELFDLGELFLPELMLCSEIMKKATGILNASVTAEKREAGGKIVIATVEGDVHDIGKSIVVSLLNAHGFQVYDLGRDIPAIKIIEKAEEVKADVIGTSSLLTTTMEGQKKLEDMLRKEGLREKYITIVGGAPVTERWAKRIGASAYAENANEGVNRITQLIKEKTSVVK